ncbi:MAG: hypothetical protein NXI32_11220, partial [bacterium]|nr:hypothetical protein [bacterium]
SEFPFLAALEHPADRMAKLAKKSYKHFLTEFGSESEELLDLKEDTLDPVRRFMTGSGAQLYTDAKQFLDRNRTNFAYLEGDEADQLETALADGRCFAAGGMKRVKELTDSLRQRLETMADDARKSAEQAIKSRVEKLKAIPGYETLSDEQRKEIDSVVDETVAQIRNQPIIAVVREAATRFETNGYTGILQKVTRWTTPVTLPQEKSSDSEGAVNPVNPQSKIENPKWIEFIGMSHLDVSFDKPWLQTNEDVERYLDSLRVAMLLAVREGKRIQL